MAADIPITIDEVSHEATASFPSRRWYWSSWTWLGGSALLVMLIVLFEIRLLWQEDAVAGQLQQRGYAVEWSKGRLHGLIPAQMRFASHFVGDHVVGLTFQSEYSGQRPIDDLIPQFKKLPKFCGIVLAAPENRRGYSFGATASISDVTNRLVALKDVRGVKSACLVGFTELTLTSTFAL